jgi:hypothetical protein
MFRPFFRRFPLVGRMLSQSPEKILDTVWERSATDFFPHAAIKIR